MFSKEIFTKLVSLLPNLPNLPIIIGEKSLERDIDDLVALALPELYAKNRVAVVDDVNTVDALGRQVFRALHGRFTPTHITLEKNMSADMEAVEYIRAHSANCAAIIAVGSGTVSDLCKYAAHKMGVPYIVFPTAASMNGYLSANASITVDAHKTTLLAQLPRAVLCDFGVIAAAPSRLCKSGLGDSLARGTAQGDWLLSHLLLDTPYNAGVFELLADIEPELFENAGGIAASDPQTTITLTKLLLLSGLGMTIAGGSHPASGGEHMIAHAYGMLKNKPPSPATLHGEEIAITSLYMAEKQEQILHSKPQIGIGKFPTDKIVELYGSELATEFAAEFAGKIARYSDADARLKNWDEIAGKIEKISIPAAKIEQILLKAKAPIKIAEIGWDEKIFANACETARFTRNRFGFLDLT